ncbi:MAG: hypothetical protein A2252_04525 [Elusimicrobia bacterium RIFOXYA2_FULL_39_19]|nr:MAG: hypothetical protein A2252_04525 [Elusimicrobia bacterium RIFOXYA2_FULL_39_19]
MAIKKRFKINDWVNWDHIVNAAVKEFYMKYEHYPNILMASTRTHAKMDAYTNITQRQRKNCITLKASKSSNQNHVGELHAFSGKGYRLEFCLDEKLPANYFYLVFDPKAKIISNTKRNRPAKPTKRPA